MEREPAKATMTDADIRTEDRKSFLKRLGPLAGTVGLLVLTGCGGGSAGPQGDPCDTDDRDTCDRDFRRS